jgi:hypothetical protein
MITAFCQLGDCGREFGLRIKAASGVCPRSRRRRHHLAGRFQNEMLSSTQLRRNCATNRSGRRRSRASRRLPKRAPGVVLSVYTNGDALIVRLHVIGESRQSDVAEMLQRRCCIRHVLVGVG